MTRTVAMRLLIGVTLLVAALLLAPTGALAHSGHSHATTPEVRQPEAVQPQQVTEEKPGGTFNQAEVNGIPKVSLEGQPYWASTASSDKSQQVCTGGCCHAAGTSCCPVSLTDVVQINGPALSRSVFDAEPPRGAGIKPGALPEPPKYLS